MSLLSDIGGAVSSVVPAIKSVASTASKVAGALNNLSNPSAIISALRSANVPTGAGGAFAATRVSFGGPGNSEDWRVKLSIPQAFMNSDVLKPLKDAGGLVFPYTPTISIGHSANYNTVDVVHQNYEFLAYQNSKIDNLTISGAFNVEDYVQAKYWIAALHFLRSATKMYTGDNTGQYQGSPPPILALNGYGDFVFKNVPVIIRSFTVELPADVDYIATSMEAPDFNYSSANALSSAAGIAGQIGGATAAAIVGGASAAFNLVNGVSNAGKTHVPTKSSISVTLQPVYSRESTRVFSLQSFVNGDYVNDTGGYI